MAYVFEVFYVIGCVVLGGIYMACKGIDNLFLL